MSAGNTIDYSKTGSAALSFGHRQILEMPLAVALERFRQAIEDAGLWVLHEIDPQAILARAGYEIAPARQLLFFHPDLMIRLLEADPGALLEAPLKFAFLSLPNERVSVRWLDAAVSLARYGNASLAALGHDLAGACETIVSRVSTSTSLLPISDRI